VDRQHSIIIYLLLLLCFVLLDAEEIASVEGVMGQLLEDLAVEGGGEAGGGQEHAMDVQELVQTGDPLAHSSLSAADSAAACLLRRASANPNETLNPNP
jgi:hypothetical protein